MVGRAFLVSFLVASTALLLAIPQGYGFHRDELYYLVCGERLGAGYVDHTVGVPFLASLIGPHLPAMLLVTAAAYAGLVALGTATAQEFGATKAQQALAALFYACSPGCIAAGSLFGTVICDLLVGTTVVYAAARWINRKTGATLLIAAAALSGLAKPTGLALVFAIAVVLVLKDRQNLKLAAGAVLASLAGVAPWLWWQSAHDWPILTFAANQRAERDPLPVYLVLAPVLGGVVGLIAIARTAGRPWHWTLGLSLAGILGYAVIGGKPYYPLAFVLPSLAYTATRLERPPGWQIATAMTGPLVALTLWPILPPGWLNHPSQTLNSVSKDRIGWRQWADGIERQAAAQGASKVLVASYGEAGALRWLGSGKLLILSGHNNYALWPQPFPGSPVITAGYSEKWLRTQFEEVTPLGLAENSWRVENEERGLPICLAKRPRDAQNLLKALRHFD